MALYGILGSIRGNLEALQAALEALERRGVRRLLCVGDVVGLNADPQACVELLRARYATVVAGRLDLAACGRLPVDALPAQAAHPLRRTVHDLGADAAAWLASLPPQQVVEERILVLPGYRAAEFSGMQVCFFGGQPAQKLLHLAQGQAIELEHGAGPLALDPGTLYLASPGSIDAAFTSGAKHARLAVLDTAAWTLEFLETRYDAASSEAKAAVYGYRPTRLDASIAALRRRLRLSAARRSAPR